MTGAVFAMGDHSTSGTYSDGSFKPDILFHTVNPEKIVGDYLARVEIAPENLFTIDSIKKIKIIIAK